MLLNRKTVYKLIYNRGKRVIKQEDLHTSGIPAYLLITQRGDNFLLHRSEDNEYKFFIFAMDKNIWHLKNSKVWISDGTFKLCSNDYYQLYVIFGSVMGSFML
ncbi:hypothetical protein DMUE_1815 [Dictyocoela muelleri]|nr:hypothetical protein DMUE_1815 [Dictyocoela muelleri]